MCDATSNAFSNATGMLQAMHVRTQRTQRTYVSKTLRDPVQFLTVRVGLWISRIHLNERAVK